jgi:hypothetical protein
MAAGYWEVYVIWRIAVMAFFESAAGLLAVLADVVSLLDRFVSEGKALNTKIDELNRKIDEKDLRRFRSSCSALKDTLDSSSSDATRSSHLSHALDGFLEFVHLDPRRDFGPLPGTRVLAIANSGLAKIYEIRGDERLFFKHRLLAFFHEPHIAREKLFPDFYQAVLSEECQKKVNDWYQQKLSGEIVKINTMKFPPALGPDSTELARLNYWASRARLPPEGRERLCSDSMTEPEEHKRRAIAEIKEQLKAQLPKMTDKACREVAEQMLREQPAGSGLESKRF